MSDQACEDFTFEMIHHKVCVCFFLRLSLYIFLHLRLSFFHFTLASDKRAACFALGGYYKGDVKNVGHTTLLQCDLHCCNGSNCNDQKPSLMPAAVTVFTPTGKMSTFIFCL